MQTKPMLQNVILSISLLLSDYYQYCKVAKPAVILKVF